MICVLEIMDVYLSNNSLTESWAALSWIELVLMLNRLASESRRKFSRYYFAFINYTF